MTNITRRQAVIGGAAGLAGTAGFWKPGFSQSEPVRIGVITELSGFAQAYGAAQRAGAEIGADRVNKAGGVNGRQIELVFRDSKTSSDASVAAYRELSSAGIKLFIVGPISGPAGAITPLVAGTDSIVIASGPTNLSMTHENYNPNVFRLAFTSIPYHGALGSLAAASAPNVKKWDVISQDAQTLQDIVKVIGNSVRKYHTDKGEKAEIADPVFAKGGAGDYRGQLGELAKRDADGLICGLVGSDAITFYKQAKAFALDKRYKIIIDNGNSTQLGKALGSTMHENMWSPTPWFYSEDSKNPLSSDVYNEYVKRTNGDKYPFGYVAWAHDAVLAFAEAAKSTKNLDTAALRTSLENGSPAGAAGPVAFRKEDHAYSGDITVLNFGGDAKGEDGWRLIKVYREVSTKWLEKATPGQKLEIE